MIKNIRHVGIVVTDLDASLHFYKDMLGFQIKNQNIEQGEYIDTILGLTQATITTVKMISPDGQMIELLEYHSDTNHKPNREIYDIGITHIALGVEDVSAAYETLKTQNVPFISLPQISPDGYAKVVFCQAPEGTFIELVEILSTI